MEVFMRKHKATVRRSLSHIISHLLSCISHLSFRISCHPPPRPRQLALSTNNIEKISSLSGMDNLRILSLGRNLIKKIENLDGVSETLEELWMSYNLLEKLVSSSKLLCFGVPSYAWLCQGFVSWTASPIRNTQLVGCKPVRLPLTLEGTLTFGSWMPQFADATCCRCLLPLFAALCSQ